jgi:ubiquinone/menaquinone biosynthesis C-methylase UbiE
MTSSTSRPWQLWDVGTVAQTIDAIWRQSSAELGHREKLAQFVAHQLSNPPGSLLEVGCGTGLVYERLVPRFLPNANYTGVDVSDRMLALARRNYPVGRFVYGDGYNLHFDDASFDIVVCFEVLGHLPDIVPFLRELFRVTNKTCLFTVWPSPAADIITTDEEIDGVRFMHQQFSDRYLRRLIRELSPELGANLSHLTIRSGVMGYVMQLPAASY